MIYHEYRLHCFALVIQKSSKVATRDSDLSGNDARLVDSLTPNRSSFFQFIYIPKSLLTIWSLFFKTFWRNIFRTNDLLYQMRKIVLTYETLAKLADGSLMDPHKLFASLLIFRFICLDWKYSSMFFYSRKLPILFGLVKQKSKSQVIFWGQAEV